MNLSPCDVDEIGGIDSFAIFKTATYVNRTMLTAANLFGLSSIGILNEARRKMPRSKHGKKIFTILGNGSLTILSEKIKPG